MEFAKRKHPRLKAFDYSQNGCYFVTLCTEHNQPFLSRVGRGLAPAGGPAPADGIAIHLTAMGQIVEQELMALQKRYPCVIIEKHVIMPTHLHAEYGERPPLPYIDGCYLHVEIVDNQGMQPK